MSPHVPTDYDPARRYPPAALIWQQDVMVTVSLSSFSGEQRQRARQHDYRTLAVLLDADPLAARNGVELRALRDRLIVAGWNVVGWAPAYTIDQAEVAAAVCAAHDLDGWIVNLEAWAEGARADLTGRWLRCFRELSPSTPLAVTCLSSVTDNFARSFDYETCLQAGAMIMPQVYGSNIAALTVAAMRGTMARAGVPDTHLAPWFSIDQGYVPVDDYATWHGPHGIWTGDAATVGRWPL